MATNRVIVACLVGAALRLLRRILGLPASTTELTVPVKAPIARFTLVARAPELSDELVGSGLLVAPVDVAKLTGRGEPVVVVSSTSAGVSVPNSHDTAPGGGSAHPVTCPARAKVLSHLSAKWPQVGTELWALHDPDIRTLRLSYGRPGQPRPRVGLQMTLDDVTALTGVRIEPETVIDHALVRWDGTLPPVAPACRERTRFLKEDLAPMTGLGITGAWVAGVGIAAVAECVRVAAGHLMDSCGG